MAQRGLTEAGIAALKASSGKQTEHPDAKTPGLSIRVSPGGTKTWVIRYLAPSGERRRMKLGTYPALTLSAARSKALLSRAAVEEDRDPARERKLTRQRSATLNELAEEYWAAAPKGLHGGRGRPKRVRSLAIERQRYDRHAAPIIGKLPFNKITRSDIRALQRRLSEGHLSPSSIAGVLGAVRAILGLAVYDERIVANPVVGVVRAASMPGRDRHWTADQARQLYASFSAPSCELEPSMSALQRFLALTLLRKNEARLATWEEVDMESRTLSIPGDRMKGGRVHVVPLAPEAIAILRGLPRTKSAGAYIFASLVERHGGLSQPFNKDAPYWALQRTCKRLNVPRGGPHDWRRTGATLLTGEALGVRRFIVSLLLAHSAHEGASITSIYDRNEYLSDKRAALERWARFLTSSSPQGANDNGPDAEEAAFAESAPMM